MLKKLLKALTCLYILSLTAVPCFAAEKELTAQLQKQYTTAKFNIVFDEPGEYDVVIIAPSSKEEYKATQTKKNEATCIIQDACAGTWTIKINKPAEMIYDEEGNLVEGEDTEIGAVHVEIQGSAQELAEVSQDIKVAADISGLKMYFRDDTFVAEWADNNKGSINVEITDAKTQEKLASESVDKPPFECDIDTALHENIVITMVPSESAQVENAERRWTMTTYNHPDASFIFPDEWITNKDFIKAKATLGETYIIEGYLNNRIIYRSDELPAGEVDIELETEVGENSYLLYVIDPQTGYMRSSTYSIVKDVVAPSIKLDRSYENITTEDASIVFEGAIDPDYKTFTINDADIKVEGDHTFKYEYELKEGINNITILAEDEAGNVSEYNTTITRVVPEVAKVPWFPILLGCCLLGLAITYIVTIFLKHRKGATEEEFASKVRKKSSGKKNNAGMYGVIDPRIAFAIRIIIPVLGVVIMLNWIICVSTVESGSMEPKLNVGNMAAYNRLAYRKHEPERGDIIAFWSDELNENLAKRVIGIPGDTLQFIDGYVFINGQRVDETEYIKNDIETNCPDTFTVPPNTVFVMGDNREYSYDSRYFKQPYIPYSRIIGKYMGQSTFNIKYMIQEKMREKSSDILDAADVSDNTVSNN